MNREIKFRAWLKNETMQYGVIPFQWDYVINTMWHKCIESNGRGILGIGGTEAKFEVGGFAFTHLMQYTGLKDKAGKEIYEGDILTYKNPTCKGDVKYGFYESGEYDTYESGTGFYLDRVDYIPRALHQRDVTQNLLIIGNIHENPDLLNQLH